MRPPSPFDRSECERRSETEQERERRGRDEEVGPRAHSCPLLTSCLASCRSSVVPPAVGLLNAAGGGATQHPAVGPGSATLVRRLLFLWSSSSSSFFIFFIFFSSLPPSLLPSLFLHLLSRDAIGELPSTDFRCGQADSEFRGGALGFARVHRYAISSHLWSSPTLEAQWIAAVYGGICHQ